MDAYTRWKEFRKTHSFWDIVEQIGWKDANAEWCTKGKKRDENPLPKLREKLIELTGGDEYIISKLRDIAVSYRTTLGNWLESYSYIKYGGHHTFPNISKKLIVSDDGWWDLRSHIVGCGRDAYLKAMTDPESIIEDYSKDSYKYVENFEYVFCIDKNKK